MDQTYILPDELKKEFRKPYGRIFEKVKDAKPIISCKRIVSVGDVISFNLIKQGIEPDILVFDEKEKRKDVEPNVRKTLHGFKGKFFIVRNPPSHITHNLWRVVKESLRQNEPVKIFVDGEEDLAVLPFILESDEDTVILYGLFDKFVVVEIDKKLKNKCSKLLNRLKTIKI